jgi:hypothetical protein
LRTQMQFFRLLKWQRLLLKKSYSKIRTQIWCQILCVKKDESDNFVLNFACVEINFQFFNLCEIVFSGFHYFEFVSNNFYVRGVFLQIIIWCGKGTDDDSCSFILSIYLNTFIVLHFTTSLITKNMVACIV